MKILAILSLLFLSQITAFSDTSSDLMNKINQSMAQAESLLAKDPSGKTSIKSLGESQIPNRIVSYFYEGSGPLEEFSAVREKRVQEVEQWLAPYEPLLINVMLAGQTVSSPPTSIIGILQFSKPSNELRDALLTVGRNTDANTDFSEEAYDTIFMLEMAGDELMQEVINKINDRDKNPLEDGIGAGLLVRAVTKWGRPELLDMYKKFLSVPLKSESGNSPKDIQDLKWDCEFAIQGLKAFGKLDQSFIDLLKARLAEMDPDEDADMINSCEETILMAEGECNPAPMVNFKGHLLGISKQTYPAWLAAHPKNPATDEERPMRRSQETYSDGEANRKTSSDSLTMGATIQETVKKYWIYLAVVCASLIAGTVFWQRYSKKNR